MKYYTEEDYYNSQTEEPKNYSSEQEFGCGFCWDRRKRKSKELFFLDSANNMRVCLFCPSCGRRYEE